MNILWISPFLLHPTRCGGQIRSLGILGQLHQRNNIHVVAFQLPGQEEGVARMNEYCTSADRIPHILPRRGSARFLMQALENCWSTLPLTIARDRSAPMRRRLEELMACGRYEVVVCDFLSQAVNVPAVEEVVLLQHNIETVIWRRMAEEAPTALQRWGYSRQAERMFAFERRVCQNAAHVIAVSKLDAATMRDTFEMERVSSISTGVDGEYFRWAGGVTVKANLVFMGSLDWMPNINGIQWFVAEVLPQIRQRKPDCTLALVGRNPTTPIRQLSERDPQIHLYADVPDVRPYLWGAHAAIVPLKVGGGTRLKIYEAMAAGTPQVSTAVGAEGLEVEHGENILLAESPEEFASACLRLLEDEQARVRIAESALLMVNERFGWLQVGRNFEQILSQVRKRSRVH
jgi:glycosyltransferase involved in cell wall biosynthesis